MSGIRYREGYNYVLHEDHVENTSIKPGGFILTTFIRLDTDGVLWLRAGYAWDGASGPAIDTRNFMRASLVHDALYQLMREGHLEQRWREAADRELVRICKEAGMWALRRAWVYAAIRVAGAQYAQPQPDEILSAP